MQEKDIKLVDLSYVLMSGLITNFPKKTPRTSMSCLNSAAGIIPPSLSDSILWMNGMAGSAADYLICGEKAGSNLAKAQQLGVKILTEQEFMEMLSA